MLSTEHTRRRRLRVTRAIDCPCVRARLRLRLLVRIRLRSFRGTEPIVGTRTHAIDREEYKSRSFLVVRLCFGWNLVDGEDACTRATAIADKTGKALSGPRTGP